MSTSRATFFSMPFETTRAPHSLSPTTPTFWSRSESSGSCAAVSKPHDSTSPGPSETRRRPPGLSPTTSHAQPPGLRPAPLMDMDFAVICNSSDARASYPVLVHRLACLLHASFRPRLAATPLRFANPSPPSGWVEDFHLQVIEHARQTKERPRAHPAASCFANYPAYCCFYWPGGVAGFLPRKSPIRPVASASLLPWKNPATGSSSSPTALRRSPSILYRPWSLT